jgi:hypothetical protein
MTLLFWTEHSNFSLSKHFSWNAHINSSMHVLWIMCLKDSSTEEQDASQNSESKVPSIHSKIFVWLNMIFIKIN